ncbi:MAG: hypothetical protein J7K40_06685 [candidate division Zixibacteria bacterium]|nr:hypothetical protein [candidate division Zixibacteria bacterium]
MKINRFVIKFSKMYHRMKLKDESVNFILLAEDMNDCLVCMPSDMKYIYEAASRLPDIASIFPNRLIKIILTSNVDPRSYGFIKRFEIIKPYSYDLNLLCLPKRTFLKKIIGKGLSICIDLDFEPNFFNSSLCALTRAPMRIGINKGMGLPYYNMEIQSGGEDVPPKKKYDNFIKVLYNFNSEGEEIAPIET